MLRAPSRTSVPDDHRQAVLEAFSPWSEIAEAAGDEPDWLLRDYLARGHVTLLSGKPKVGKSTLAIAVADAVDDRDSVRFLERYVDYGPVVYISEEGNGTLGLKLGDSPHSVALTRDGVWPKPTWSDLIEAAIVKAAEIEAVLLVIDSLAFWASFGNGQEKDAGATQATMDVLTEATRAGLAVLLVHHQRKSGGDEGDAVRGSGAILGAVDMSIEVERVGDAASTKRRLVTTGRWESPPVTVIDRDTGTGAWRVIGRAGSRDEAEVMGGRELLIESLPTEPPGSTEEELNRLLGRRQVTAPLREAVAAGLVTQTGKGVKGSPFLYYVARSECSSTGEGETPCEFSSTPLGVGERKNGIRFPHPELEEKVPAQKGAK